MIHCDADDFEWRRYQLRNDCPGAAKALRGAAAPERATYDDIRRIAGDCEFGIKTTDRPPRGGSMTEFRGILKTGFESIETFVKLSAYWHHFCMPQFNSRNVKWLCHFPDMWWCAATGPIVHRGRDELARDIHRPTV